MKINWQRDLELDKLRQFENTRKGVNMMILGLDLRALSKSQLRIQTTMQ